MLFATTFFAVFLHICVVERSSLSRIHEYPELQIYTDSRQIDGIPLVYARCNSSEAFPKSEMQCIVTMKFDVFEKSAGETKECTVNLESDLSYGMINDRKLVYAFGRDKVLLVWTETQSASDSEDDTEQSILWTTVVHMFDGCRTFEAKVREDLQRPFKYFQEMYINVVAFNDTYDIRLADVRKDCEFSNNCPVDAYRLYKFDSRARQADEAKEWPMPPFNGVWQSSSMESLKLDESEKKYFVVNEDASNLLFEIISETSRGYHQMWEFSNLTSSHPIYRWSLANEAIGFCHKYANASYGCWKSDQKGHIHTQMNFSLNVPRKSHLSAVYNLRNGKLLLALSKCSKSDCYGSGRSKNNENYYLMEVDGTGNVNSVEARFESMCHRQDNDVFMRLFENKQGQYCIVRLCESIQPRQLVKGRLESSVLCYSSDEFSKCTRCL